MLRALSQSVPPDARNGLAAQRVATVDRTVDDLFGAVTIVNPGGSYTLATEHSPLPLALRNDLPVPIRVRLRRRRAAGDDGRPTWARSSCRRATCRCGCRSRCTSPSGSRSTSSLRTADGLPLGEPVRLSVHSNAYGKVLFFITLSAGAVLVLLAGRRLWHRFRGQPDRADLDRPPESTRSADDEPARRRAAAIRSTSRSPTPRTTTRERTDGDRCPAPPRQRIPRGPAPRRRAGQGRGTAPPRRSPSCPTPPWCRGRGAWRSRRWSAGSPGSSASCCSPRSSVRPCRVRSRWPTSCRT